MSNAGLGKGYNKARNAYRVSPVAELNWTLGISVDTKAIREADIYFTMTE